MLSLAMELPTTLHIPMASAPRCLASLNAAKVSAVSPDCEIKIIPSSLLIIGFLYLNSDAYSTSVGTRAFCSSIYSPTSPECHEVPQAEIIILLELTSLSETDSSPPNLAVDRKSTRLNSSHLGISYAVFCLKKKK